MPACQREEIMVREGGPPTGSHGVMAFQTIRGEAGRRMIRRAGGHVIGLVTIDALIPESRESKCVVGPVTIHAA